MIDERQEDELVGLGDCQLHWHSSDRKPRHEQLRGYQGIMNVQVKSASYTLTDNDDVIICDATATFTLPLSKGKGVEYEFVLRGVGATMTIVPSGTDTVQGTTSIVSPIRWTALHLKAISGGWVII